MVGPIDPTLSNSPAAAQNVPVEHPIQAPRPVQAAAQDSATAATVQEGPAVAVELSPAAQARLMRIDGNSIPEIALKLRLDEVTVGEYVDRLI